MTDQLIFVHDKRRDAYVDKTSEIVGLRPAGAYVYVDYGAARVFRYRKEHVVCYPLLATRRQVRIYKDGTLRSRTIRCSTTGNMSGWAPERACVRRRSRSRGSKRSMRSRSPQTKSGYFPISRRFSQPKPLWSRRPIRKPQRRFPKGRRKVRSPPCSPRRCSASIRRIPVRRCMPI